MTRRTERVHSHADKHNKRDNEGSKGTHQMFDGSTHGFLDLQYVLAQVDDLQQVEDAQTESGRADTHEGKIPVGDHVEADEPFIFGFNNQPQCHDDRQLANDVCDEARVREQNDGPVDEKPHGDVAPSFPKRLGRFVCEKKRLAYGEENVGDATRNDPDVAQSP